MLNGNISIGGGGGTRQLYHGEMSLMITFSFFYYEAEDITLKTILKSRVSLRKKY